ncbi:unnamed protein product [Brassica oleracea]|uniref:(rape) hypothetical protein n=1 Tax=Brassica napus TaxID=3708 RepID=A0A816M5T3_BRANA|nr:unnamed protein product [Brassica napus]
MKQSVSLNIDRDINYHRFTGTTIQLSCCALQTISTKISILLNTSIHVLI